LVRRLESPKTGVGLVMREISARFKVILAVTGI
jgi:hypothetical protein